MPCESACDKLQKIHHQLAIKLMDSVTCDQLHMTL